MEHFSASPRHRNGVDPLAGRLAKAVLVARGVAATVTALWSSSDLVWAGAAQMAHRPKQFGCDRGDCASCPYRPAAEDTGVTLLSLILCNISVLLFKLEYSNLASKGSTSMAGRRHSTEEIIDKLREADDMMEKGHRQGEIAGALGISVMTYHRWRKARPHLGEVAKLVPSWPTARPSQEHVPLDELRTENKRLRRLVADLMLEIVRLEEAHGERAAVGASVAKNGWVSARHDRPE
jgi:putative transposase